MKIKFCLMKIRQKDTEILQLLRELNQTKELKFNNQYFANSIFKVNKDIIGKEIKIQLPKMYKDNAYAIDEFKLINLDPEFNYLINDLPIIRDDYTLITDKIQVFLTYEEPYTVFKEFLYEYRKNISDANFIFLGEQLFSKKTINQISKQIQIRLFENFMDIHILNIDKINQEIQNEMNKFSNNLKKYNKLDKFKVFNPLIVSNIKINEIIGNYIASEIKTYIKEIIKTIKTQEKAKNHKKLFSDSVILGLEEICESEKSFKIENRIDLSKLEVMAQEREKLIYPKNIVFSNDMKILDLLGFIVQELFQEKSLYDLLSSKYTIFSSDNEKFISLTNPGFDFKSIRIYCLDLLEIELSKVELLRKIIEMLPKRNINEIYITEECYNLLGDQLINIGLKYYIVDLFGMITVK